MVAHDHRPTYGKLACGFANRGPSYIWSKVLFALISVPSEGRAGSDTMFFRAFRIAAFGFCYFPLEY